MAGSKWYYFAASKTKKNGKTVYRGKRNTPVAGTSAANARKKLKRPSPKTAVVYAVRTPTKAERKTAARGGWVRNRSNGKPPSSDSKRGYGPPRRKRKKK